MQNGQSLKPYSLTAVVELIFDSVGGSSIILEISFANQSGEVHYVRSGFRVSALINTAGSRVLGKRRVRSQISGAVYGTGRGNRKGVTIAGNAKHDLVRGETSSGPSLNGLGGGAGLEVRARVIQGSVGTDTRGPLTLRSELSDVLLA